MRRYLWGYIAGGAYLLQGGFAVAQSSLDALQQELNEAKQQHQDVSSQVLSNFFSQLDPAMASPDSATALYQQAGGAMPDPSPIVTQNEDETPTEKQARLAFDQANLTRLGTVLQLQCGLMHYAALFVVKPNQPGLQNDWVTWLKSAAQLYPQIAVPAQPDAPPQEHHKKRREDGQGNAKAQTRPPPFDPSDVAGKAMKDTAISKFLAFNAWGDKEQGGWAVKDLPKLYRTNVLEPLRASPTADTLAAWDAFIAMANADEKDNDKWNQVVYPPLQFDRACDAYSIAPSTDKLEALVNLVKANPTYPKVDDWISRVSQLMGDYRSHHGGGPASAQNPAGPTPSNIAAGGTNVTVTKEGDMTIITTNTNSAPSPSAPTH